MTLLGLVWTMHAIAIDRAGADVEQVPVPDLIGVFGQLDAFQLGLPVGIEQAQLHFGGVGGKQGKIRAATIPKRTPGMRQALTQLRRKATAQADTQMKRTHVRLGATLNACERPLETQRPSLRDQALAEARVRFAIDTAKTGRFVQSSRREQITLRP